MDGICEYIEASLGQNSEVSNNTEEAGFQNLTKPREDAKKIL